MLLTSMLATASVAASGATYSLQAVTDRQADAKLSAALHRPIVILFSLPGCHFCDEVRQNYLLPLVRDSAPDQRPIVREIVVTGSGAITGLHGEPTDEKAVAKAYGIRVTPSVLMLDASGRLLVPAVVGGDTSGLYGGYLDGALRESERLLGAH